MSTDRSLLVRVASAITRRKACYNEWNKSPPPALRATSPILMGEESRQSPEPISFFPPPAGEVSAKLTKGVCSQQHTHSSKGRFSEKKVDELLKQLCDKVGPHQRG